MSTPGRTDSTRNVLLLVAAAACWGGGTVVSKQAVAEIPPLTLLPIQLAASVAFLALVGRVRGTGLPTDRDGRLLGRLGLLNPGLAYALSLVGLVEITASLSVLLWALEPVLILVLAAFVLRERLGGVAIVATAVAVAGLALVVADPAANGSALGIALTVAGVAVCAIYTVAARRWLPGTSDSTIGVVLAQQVHALAFAIVVVAVLGLAGRQVAPSGLSLTGLASAVASGLLYYAFAYLCYLTALRAVRASVAAASFYLIPVFGVAFGMLAGERLEPVQWLGAAIVVGAVIVLTTRHAAVREGEGQPSSASASTHTASSPSAANRS